MKTITLLGASGSIGTQCIDIVDQHPDLFQITSLSVGNKIDMLKQYLNTHNLENCCVKNREDANELSKLYPDIHFFYGDEGLIELTSLKADLVFNALQGFVGLKPTMNAIHHKRDIALSNKETLVAAGDIVTAEAKKYGVSLIPVDSEHSAIFQTLQGAKHDEIKRLIITASGGPFRNKTREELKDVTLQQALHHPRWTMGAKITIDSATMMNKGFEVIEAHMLFDIPYEKIDTIIHPQSIVHSMTEFNDHCVLAQLGVSDMREPIQYALSYPNRIANTSETLSLEEIGKLEFEKMNYERFPLLKLAYDCGKAKGNLCAAMNGANEAAVHLFLNQEIEFLDIERIIFETVELAKERFIINPTLDDIIDTNEWAIETAKALGKGSF